MIISIALEFMFLYMAALCLLFAPAAGLVTGLMARSRGLSARKYAAIGAFYCALIILPWLHLTMRMIGKKPNVFCIVSGYGFLYAWWLFAQVCSFGVLESASNFSRRVFGSSAGSDAPYAILFLITLALLAISIIHIVVYKQASVRRSARPDTFLIPIAYLMPFVYVWVGHALFVVYVIEFTRGR